MTNTPEDVWEKISQRRPQPILPRLDPEVEKRVEAHRRNRAADKLRAYIKDLIFSYDAPEEIAFEYVDGDLIAAYWDGEREHHFSVFVEMNPVTNK